MLQKRTSSNTSINAKKLPAISKKVDWKKFSGKTVLDIGGGKYNNFKEWLKASYNVDLLIYDKFNRSIEENQEALSCTPSLIICSNVLNVIDSNEVIEQIVDLIESYNTEYIITVYQGNGSNIGNETKKDCYQRNSKISEYLRFFKTGKLVKGTITNK